MPDWSEYETASRLPTREQRIAALAALLERADGEHWQRGPVNLLEHSSRRAPVEPELEP